MFAGLIVLIGATRAEAQAVPGEPLDTPFNVSIGVNNTFGAATLVSDSEFTQTDYFLTSTSASITYMATDELSFSLGGGLSKYLSRAGGINSQYEMRRQDTSLSASIFPLVVEPNTGIITTAGVSLLLPTSDLSQAEGLYPAASLGLTLLKPVGGMILVYSFDFTKNFHAYTSQVFETTELDIIVREGGTERLGANRVAVDGVLSSFAVTNAFALIYNFHPAFQFRTSLTWSDSWTYDNGTITREDAFTSPNAVVGRGHRQTVVGSFGLRYLLVGQSFFGRGLTARFGVNTGGAPLTEDNKGVRFPFWDFENGQSSRTSISFGLGGTY